MFRLGGMGSGAMVELLRHLRHRCQETQVIVAGTTQDFWCPISRCTPDATRPVVQARHMAVMRSFSEDFFVFVLHIYFG